MGNEIGSGADADVLVGFVVIVDRGDAGYAGGYLCTNQHGVPIEFRYTAPVKPTRPQELLYGRALKPQLFGKHIAETLLKDAEHPPMAVLTDDSAVLAGYEPQEPPIFQVVPDTQAGGARGTETSQRVETPGGAVLLTWRKADSRAPELIERLSRIDLREPFERAKKVLDEILESSGGIAGGA